MNPPVANPAEIIANHLVTAVAVDTVVVAAEEAAAAAIAVIVKCSLLFVQLVELKPKFLSNQIQLNQFIAAIVSRNLGHNLS